MKQNKYKLIKIIGWILFLFAIGLFCLQMGYLLIHERYQVEYIDNRLFYIINIFCVICLYLAILFLFQISKKVKIIGVSIAILFITFHAALLVQSNKEIKNIISISPDFKNVFSIKEHINSGVATYYRSYYGILARPKEILPHKIVGEYQVEWLANDVAAFTYQSTESTIQQFIGTYGDRKNGLSYYNVGPEIQGIWQGDNVKVISNPEGISVTEDNETELFEWDNIKQFGTLAVVLMENNEAVWTISLHENFVVHSDASETMTGNITLYKASMGKEQALTLNYKHVN